MDGARSQYTTRMNVQSPYIRNKIPAFQSFFQRPDGNPVFLKGKIDHKMYRGVMAFSVIGLGITLFSIYRMATGQITKKEQ